MNKVLRLALLFLLANTLLLITQWERVAFANNDANPSVEMVGEIVTDSGSSFASMEDEVALAIDPSLIVKGDVLGLYNSKHPDAKLIGHVLVMSNSDENQRGKLINTSREIFGETFIGFELPKKTELNRFVPYLQSLADLYLASPGQAPLNVALIDVVNRYGDKTEGGDILLKKIRSSVCSRPQFSCAPQAKLTEYLWSEGVVTSRNIDRKIERGLRKRLGIEVIITGHIKETDSGIDLILMATHTDTGYKPRAMWRRFAFSYDKLEFSPSSLASVTTSFRKRSMGKLAIRRIKVKSVDGMKVEYFSYENLIDWIDTADGKNDSVMAGDFFVRVDGHAYPMDMNGVFYNDKITAGKHRVTFGYYPAILKNGRTLTRAKVPLQKNIEIALSEGEALNLDVIGKIEGSYGILIGDSYGVEGSGLR